MTKVSMDKEYRTRDGRRVRLYSTIAVGLFPVHGTIDTERYGWIAHSWNAEGRGDNATLECANDLVEVQKPMFRWFTVYEDGSCGVHASWHEADAGLTTGRVGRVRLDVSQFFGRWDEEEPK
jgi:hypothetical protein